MTLEQARLGILPADIQEHFDERAGIYEYEAGMTRKTAEELAFLEIEKTKK